MNPTRKRLCGCRRTQLKIGIVQGGRRCSCSLRHNLIGIRGAVGSRSEPLNLSLLYLTQNLLLTQLKLHLTQLSLNSGRFGVTNREVSLSGLESSTKLITPCVSFSHLSPKKFQIGHCVLNEPLSLLFNLQGIATLWRISALSATF